MCPQAKQREILSGPYIYDFPALGTLPDRQRPLASGHAPSDRKSYGRNRISSWGTLATAKRDEFRRSGVREKNLSRRCLWCCFGSSPAKILDSEGHDRNIEIEDTIRFPQPGIKRPSPSKSYQ